MKKPLHRILIVEDNMIIAFDIKKRLEKLGYKIVGIAMNGEDAIDMTFKHEPNLILMDISLKGEMNGIEIMAKIRQKFAVPVIYLTGNGGLLKKAKISDLCINKPFHEDELKNLIFKVLENKLGIN